MPRFGNRLRRRVSSPPAAAAKLRRSDEMRGAPASGIRFAVKYALIGGFGFVVYGFPYAESGLSERLFEVYLEAYAQVVGVVLGAFEPTLRVEGSELIGRFPLRIAKNCDAVEANILLGAAVLALPISFNRRILGLTIGIGLLGVLNVTRICCLYFIGVHARPWFDFAHLELWPLILVACSGIAFVVLARWLQRPNVVLTNDPGSLGLGRGVDIVRRRKAALVTAIRRWRCRGVA